MLSRIFGEILQPQPAPWEYTLQAAASPVMESIISFHNLLLAIITVISLVLAAVIGAEIYARHRADTVVAMLAEQQAGDDREDAGNPTREDAIDAAWGEFLTYDCDSAWRSFLAALRGRPGSSKTDRHCRTRVAGTKRRSSGSCHTGHRWNVRNRPGPV